jgi:hypothetical protein
VHVCKETIQDYKKKYFQNPDFLIFENFLRKNDLNFSLFHQNLIKTIFLQQFKKNLVKKGLNQQKMARDIDF